MCKPTSNTSKRRSENIAPIRRSSDEFDDDGLDDNDLFGVPLKDLEFDHIENYPNPNDEVTRRNTAKNAEVGSRKKSARTRSGEEKVDGEPKQLENGKWACNHKCKEKTACKHMCCRDGLDRPRPPKKSAKKSDVLNEHVVHSNSTNDTTQTRLQLTASKRKSSTGLQVLDLTRPDKKVKPDYAIDGPKEFRELNSLHEKVQKNNAPVSIWTITHTKPAYCYSAGGEHTLSFMESEPKSEREGTTISTDYGDLLSDPPHYEEDSGTVPNVCDNQWRSATQTAHHGARAQDRLSDRNSEDFGDNDSLLGDVMIGLADSQEIQTSSRKKDDMPTACEDDPFDFDDDLYTVLDQGATADAQLSPPANAKKDHSGFFGQTSTSTAKVPHQENTTVNSPHFKGSKKRIKDRDFVSAKNMVEDSVLQELQQTKNQALSINMPQKTPNAKETEESMESVATEGASTSEEKEVQQDEEPDPRYKDLEPWLLAEFGGIVELVDE
jgi:ATP-dependent DNA helicase HFM1/MER3